MTEGERKPMTYEDISKRNAEWVLRHIAADYTHGADAMRYMLMAFDFPPLTRWQKVRRFIRRLPRRARWWLSGLLHDLADWIEP